jgi:hypothetical protein
MRSGLVLSFLIAAAAARIVTAVEPPTSAQSGPISGGATNALFTRDAICFLPEDSTRPGGASGPAGESADNGRLISREVELPDLPDFEGPVRATVHLVIEPVAKDPESVFDRWDRAGDVRLAVPGLPDLELVKFITPYGGRTEFDVDVSPLVPLLRGHRIFRAFIDTWVAPAWTVTGALALSRDSTAQNAVWVRSVLFEQAYTAKDPGMAGREVTIEIPNGLDRVILVYLVSGHCTDGTDADEFVQKDNVISVDGRVVYRYRPWRDDCRAFRERNPYCRRWSDGSWSCDYSRSGWCPGDVVRPLQLDLTDHLTPGRHALRFVVEDVRPKDEKGHYGYWRLSAYLTGWKL